MVGVVEVFLFLCVVGYLFNKNRTDDMVDVISTRLQDFYGSWRLYGTGGESTQRTGERSSVDVLRRYGDEHRRRKIQNKDLDKRTLDSYLYQIKETHTPTITLPVNQLHGLACRHCAPKDGEIQLDPVERQRDVKDILCITQHAGWRPDSSIFDWGGWFPCTAQCFRLKRFVYPQVSGTVLKDDRLKVAIELAAKESVTEKKQHLFDPVAQEKFDEQSYYREMIAKHEKRARFLVFDMRSKISDLLLRITSWVLYRLLPCFLTGVVAHPAQVEMLKTAAERLPGVPLIFLPLHRSHLDYILVSFILLNNDIQSPIVAAGNNLKIPFFGALLRGLGAFFIKRKIDPVQGKKDHVYRTVLHTYMQHALSAGHNVEFFIEGGRTRTGKPCMPKSGVLSVIVDAYMGGTISDALLVPVSVNYEKLVDGNFIHEQLGQKKKPESFTAAIKAIWQILHSNYGLMRIDFNEPFSIRELVKSFNKLSHQEDTVLRSSDPSCRRLQQNPSTTSLYGTDIVQEEQRTLVDSIARHVVYDCASATAVMTTNALAFLLLTRFRDGATLSVLSEALDGLRTLLYRKKDIGFTGLSDDVIKYGAELLGSDMIVSEKRAGQLFYKPITAIPNVIELSYYANSLVPYFALESIIVTALHTLRQEFEEEKPTMEFQVSRDELLKSCIDHCDILRYEFILSKPCQNIDTLLNESLDQLHQREIVHIPEITYTEQQQWSRRMARQFEDSDDEYSVENYVDKDQPMILLPTDGHCERICLINVLAPFGLTYLMTAICLKQLLNKQLIESEFIKLCVNELREQYETGKSKFGESISTDTIRNCIRLFEKWCVVEVCSNTGVRIIALKTLYDSKEGVDSVIQRIQKIVPYYPQK